MIVRIATADGFEIVVNVELGTICSQLKDAVWAQQNNALQGQLFQAAGDDDLQSLIRLLRRGAAVHPTLVSPSGMHLPQLALQRKATSCVPLLERLSHETEPQILWKLSWGGVELPDGFLLEDILDDGKGEDEEKDLRLFLCGFPWSRDSYMQAVEEAIRKHKPGGLRDDGMPSRPQAPILVPDDCSAQEAFAHVRDGQTIFFRQGLYTCSEDVEIRRKCHVIGEPGTTLNGVLRFKSSSEGVIKGVLFVARGLCMSVTGRWRMEDCGIENSSGDAVIVWGGELSMKGCRIGSKTAKARGSNVFVMGDAALRAECCEFWAGGVGKGEERAYVVMKGCSIHK